MRIKILAALLPLLVSLLFFPVWELLNAATVDQVIAAAKKEGALEFYAPSTLTAQGAKQLEDAFNKNFGTDIRINYSQSGSMTADVSKYIGEAAAGNRPQWDVMVLIDALHGSIWKRKLRNIVGEWYVFVSRCCCDIPIAQLNWSPPQFQMVKERSTSIPSSY